jgi:hypothetical protein
MPSFEIYADDEDNQRILHILNVDSEVAFIVANGHRRWIARQTLDHVQDGNYCIWHVDSGPLPLIGAQREISGVIENPWSGWTEERTGGDPSVPWFGDSPGQIFWNVRVPDVTYKNKIGISAFSWIGNYWRPVGKPANPKTEKWWAKFRRMIKKIPSRLIPRIGPVDGPKPEIWALPSALSRIENGVVRAAWVREP